MDERDELDEMADGIVHIIKAVAETVPSLVGPLGDLIRGTYAAQTDSLVDMRKRLIEDGWPTELADQVVLVTLTRATSFTDAVAKAIKERKTT